MILSTVDRTLSSLSKEAALFSALVFTISSWTIGRGMHPNKLNFFYPLMILIGIVALRLYQSVRLDKTAVRRWFTLGLWLIPAIVFGHRFSSGATLLLLFSIFIFAVIARRFLSKEYTLIPQGFLSPFVMVYFLSVIGNPLHQGPLIGRLSGIITSVIIPAGSGGSGPGGPGRFSQLQLDVLVASTTAQTIIFALAVIGSIWMFQQQKWEYDVVVFYIVSLGGFIGIALAHNSVDTAPQRFYGVLILFGFNIAIAVGFDVLRKQKAILPWLLPDSGGKALVTILVILLAATSLASPVSERATSPVSDEIPDIRQFDTEPLLKGNDWADRYTVNETQIVAPNSDVPIERTGPTQGTVARTAIDSGSVVMYSKWSKNRGVGTTGGETLGGNRYLFVPSPERPSDNRVYVNGETIAFSTQVN